MHATLPLLRAQASPPCPPSGGLAGVGAEPAA